MELLGSGYPYEIHITNHELGGINKIFVPEQTGIDIQNDLMNKDVRYISIGGAIYFWSDVKYCDKIKIPLWLDKLLFTSNLITKQENRLKVLKELTRRMKSNRGFTSEDDVFIFLTLSQESK